MTYTADQIADMATAAAQDAYFEKLHREELDACKRGFHPDFDLIPIVDSFGNLVVFNKECLACGEFIGVVPEEEF